MRKSPLLILIFFLFNQSLTAQNVLSLKDGEKGQKAKVEEMNWLAGRWVGPGFGGNCEESWNPASGGNMLGTFKYHKDGKTNFTEIMTILEKEGSLSLLVKHFSADFIAWEDKEDYVEFPLIKLEKNKAWFDGLTLHKTSKKKLSIYLRMKDEEGVKEVSFFFTKAK